MNLRPAALADAERLFFWRNDPETRQASRNTDPVSWDSHIAWLTSSLVNPNRQILIAINDDGIPCGTIRIDGDELSWTTAPEFRGQGIATEMVKAVTVRPGCYTAFIKPENAASIRVAEKCGFTMTGEENGLQRWYWPKSAELSAEDRGHRSW